MTKVTEMTVLILMPMSWAVSKSRDTARMAMPTLVRLMSWVRASTSSHHQERGDEHVTILVGVPAMVTVSGQARDQRGRSWAGRR